MLKRISVHLHHSAKEGAFGPLFPTRPLQNLSGAEEWLFRQIAPSAVLKVDANRACAMRLLIMLRVDSNLGGPNVSTDIVQVKILRGIHLVASS
jgi:hypothetical protein